MIYLLFRLLSFNQKENDADEICEAVAYIIRYYEGSTVKSNILLDPVTIFFGKKLLVPEYK